MKTIFLRAIEAEDKSATLLMAIHDPESARGKHRFEVDLASFAGVPRSPFAYWISERLRRVFVEFAAFSIHHLAIRGAYTTNDFLFYLLAWEIKPERIAVARLETFVDKPFVLLAKGGSWSPYYHDVHLAIRWSDDGVQAKAYLAAYRESKGWGTDWSACLNGYGQYFRPGLTWPRRTTSRLALRVMPAGCIFADKGPAAFVPQDDDQALLSLLAIANSSAFGAVTELQLAAADAAARSYEVGVIQRTPVPQLSSDDQSTLATLSRRAWSLKRSLDTRNETSHAFAIPALLQVAGETLVGRSSAWSDYVPRIEAELTTIQAEVDARCFNLYGIDEADRRAITEGFGGSVVSDDAESDEEGDAEEAAADAASLAAELVSWSVGVAFGRFDVRLGTGTRAVPPEPEPFDPLPACSPGMLTGDDGLPLTAAPKGYPIQPPDSGIMVDDLGHALDLGAAVRSVFDPVFGDEAEARWQEAVAILDPRSQDLRQWLPKVFFEHHLKRYSRSRRQAPIYWPLSSSGGGYTIWLYYHRFRRDTLFSALNDFAKPKLQHERFKLDRLRGEAGPQPTRSHREAIEAQESFVSELEGFAEELARVAPLWNPALNDGVIINFAPLWRMIGHTSWRKNVKDCWDTLCAGDYDWSHLAMHLWPERVVPKCAEDASLAIAHGLDEVFWEKSDRDRLVKKAPPAVGWRPEIDRRVAERTSPAVKSALDSLLSAPAPSGRPGEAEGGSPMLEYLYLKNVSPAPEMEMDLAHRLNLVTGDNRAFLEGIEATALSCTE